MGGVATNQGQLNPVQWNWVNQGAWKTYAGIIGGGFFGYMGGWYMLNPGNLQVAANIITPLGTVGIVGQASNWSFQWTTNAGGGGSVPIGNNNRQNTSAAVQQQINNVSANYRKDKQYEYYMYLQSQYANTSNNTDNYSVQFIDNKKYDWNLANEKQRVAIILYEIHKANKKGEMYLDIEGLFVNFPDAVENGYISAKFPTPGNGKRDYLFAQFFIFSQCKNVLYIADPSNPRNGIYTNKDGVWEQTIWDLKSIHGFPGATISVPYRYEDYFKKWLFNY